MLYVVFNQINLCFHILKLITHHWGHPMQNSGILINPIRQFVNQNARELSFIDGNLMGVTDKKIISSILITSCSAMEGKTVSVVSTAIGLSSKAGVKVALLDANMEEPTLHKVFGINSGQGLSDLIFFRGGKLKEKIYSTEYKNLSVIPFGKNSIGKKMGKFEINRFKQIVNALKTKFDYVLVDGPSLFTSPLIILMANQFDGVLFVIESDKTRWEILQEAVKKVQNVGGNVIGVVMNKRKYYVPRWFYDI
jgi:protein-tyrosine kinase